LLEMKNYDSDQRGGTDAFVTIMSAERPLSARVFFFQ